MAVFIGPTPKLGRMMRASEFVIERKKRRKRSRWAFSGPGGWYGYYYGHSSEAESGGDGGGGESVRENSSKNSNVIFLNDTAAVVGQEHGRPLKLSAEDKQRIQDIAREHGAWYEGNGMDQEFTKGVIDDYRGSWDDDLLSPAVEGYPAAFLYVLFSNIKENDTVKGKIGSDPDSTIFDRILDTQPSTNYFPERRFDAETLAKFLKAVSEGSYDFVQMSQAPATEQNVAKFFKLGERLMWPSNWEEYPNRAGRVAKSVNDLRDKFLASRKHGVYVTGSDHLIAVRELLNQSKQDLAEGLDEAVGGNYLYHATSADGLRGMLSSGSIRSATGPQAATQAQTKMPTVSVTRDWGYASGASAQPQMGGIGRDAVLILDRGAVENNFKTLSTSQSNMIQGQAFNPFLKKDGEARSQNTDPMARTNAKAKAKYAEPTAKAGGEFEEAIIVPKGELPLKGTMIGFWVNPKSELMKDPTIINDHRRLDIVRPNQFVKATQQQGVAENFADGKVKGKSRPGRVKRAGASCAGSVTDLRARAKKYGGERGRMYHWCANMKSGRKK
jgi:phage gp37-like protein